MPKKKTGQRKKREKQRNVQKSIQAGSSPEDLKNNPANREMTCDRCGRRQKTRLMCYFCQSVQKLISCSQCGRQKCLSAGGDCMVKHPGRNATGLAFVGAVCDFCEGAVCHSRKCLQTHACSCALRDGEATVICIECDRCLWDFGGRAFRCNTCNQWLCEDDQFEHQASCQILESETYKCVSCNRIGVYSCLRCKVCYCADHHRGAGEAVKKGGKATCKKCGYELQETKDLSMSVRKHEYGRHAVGDDDDDDYGGGGGGFYGYGGGGGDSDDDDSDDESEDESEGSDESEAESDESE
eukprot:GHVN01055716.1.p1 GENE.GHVN01055716.1~~GHVN01055716.1.p1  ORF type:complete len:297 (+),score=60.66 GHVN01055716.1:84-974(+)